MDLKFSLYRQDDKLKNIYDNYIAIKYNWLEIGTIDLNKPHRIRFICNKTSNVSRSKVITLKKESKSVEEAKYWVALNFDVLNNKYDIINL